MLKINKWLDYTIPLDSKILNEEIIKDSLNLFWAQVMVSLKEDQFILIQFKITDISKEIKSISYVQCVNKKDFNSLLNSFT